MQLKVFLVEHLFAIKLSLTVSYCNAFVVLIFTRLICVKTLSTHADECGKTVKVVIDNDNI